MHCLTIRAISGSISLTEVQYPGYIATNIIYYLEIHCSRKQYIFTDTEIYNPMYYVIYIKKKKKIFSNSVIHQITCINQQ